MQKSAIALFNFDHTVTTIDTFKGFVRFSIDRKKRFWKFFVLFPSLAMYKLHIISAAKVREKVFGSLFNGMDEQVYRQKAEEYSLKVLPSKIRREAERKILWHVRNHHETVIASASMEAWIAPWARTRGANVIATKAEIVDGKLTGKFEGPVCFGEEKAERIKGTYDLDRFAYVFAYGNVKRDKAMIALAHEKHFDEFI